MTTVRDRAVGALVGLAVGDALGAPLEFAARGVLPLVTTMQGGGKFRLGPGQWTDDTSMAWCIAASLVETGQFDLRDQLTRFLRWRDDGYLSSRRAAFGIGQQTFRALSDFDRTGELVRRESGWRGAGNGSLMRLAPIPIVFAHDVALAARASRASSMTTHPAVVCREACAVFGTLVAGAINGWDKERLLDEARAIAGDTSSAELRSVLAGGYLEKSRDEISSSGFVVDTLEAALWSFARSTDFRDGAIVAVNLAGDADTVGAVYGQLAGAHYGYSAIPAEWLMALHRRQQLVDTAERLYGLVGDIRIAHESQQYLAL